MEDRKTSTRIFLIDKIVFSIWYLYMQNSISSKPVYIKDFYFNTLNGLFWVQWALSWYVVGLDIDPSIVSMQKLDDYRVSLQLSPFHSINLPEVGIQRGTNYDCLIWSEKKLLLRFTVNLEGKISIIRAHNQIIRPNIITITQTTWESDKLSSWVLSGLKTKFSEIFSSKK